MWVRHSSADANDSIHSGSVWLPRCYYLWKDNADRGSHATVILNRKWIDTPGDSIGPRLRSRFMELCGPSNQLTITGKGAAKEYLADPARSLSSIISNSRLKFKHMVELDTWMVYRRQVALRQLQDMPPDTPTTSPLKRPIRTNRNGRAPPSDTEAAPPSDHGPEQDSEDQSMDEDTKGLTEAMNDVSLSKEDAHREIEVELERLTAKMEEWNLQQGHLHIQLNRLLGTLSQEAANKRREVLQK